MPVYHCFSRLAILSGVTHNLGLLRGALTHQKDRRPISGDPRLFDTLTPLFALHCLQVPAKI